MQESPKSQPNQNPVSSTPELITGVPSPDILRRQYGRVMLKGHVERIEPHLTQGTEDGAKENDQDRIVLHNLQNELNFGNPGEFSRTIRSFYAMARNIGDATIARHDTEAFRMIDATRSFASRHSFVAGNYGVGQVFERLDENGGNSPVMHVNVHDIFNPDSENNKVLEKNIASLGLELKPGHQTLLQLMKYVSHEAGHAIQYGVGRVTQPAPDSMFNGYDGMSARLLQLRPELGITPNLYTNTRIHNERFAEGYSKIVLQEVATILGYDQTTADKINRVFGFESFNEVEASYMPYVTETTSIKDLAKQNSIDLYDGQAGYSMPLSLDEISRDLKVISADIRQKLEDDEAY